MGVKDHLRFLPGPQQTTDRPLSESNPQTHTDSNLRISEKSANYKHFISLLAEALRHTERERVREEKTPEHPTFTILLLVSLNRVLFRTCTHTVCASVCLCALLFLVFDECDVHCVNSLKNRRKPRITRVNDAFRPICYKGLFSLSLSLSLSRNNTRNHEHGFKGRKEGGGWEIGRARERRAK